MYTYDYTHKHHIAHSSYPLALYISYGPAASKKGAKIVSERYNFLTFFPKESLTNAFW